ncbi:MAG: hypothetical protein ABEL76_03610 [Bradymonadaceae bacterium]
MRVPTDERDPVRNGSSRARPTLIRGVRRIPKLDDDRPPSGESPTALKDHLRVGL